MKVAQMPKPSHADRDPRNLPHCPATSRIASAAGLSAVAIAAAGRTD